MRVTAKTVFFLLLFILVLPLYAQQTDRFTLDEWASLYEEGFFGEIEPLIDEKEIFDEEFFTPEENDEYLKDEEVLINVKQALLENKEVIDSEIIIEITEDDHNQSTEEVSLAENTEESADEEEAITAEEEIAAEAEIIEEEDYDLLFEGPSFVFEVPEFEMRSFNDIFPDFTPRQKTSAMRSYGLRYFFKNNEKQTIVPHPDYGIDLYSSVMSRKPSHLIEILLVVPYIDGKELDLIDIYNALGRIGNIKDYPVPYMQDDYYVFTESTRIVSNRNRREVADPLPATNLPFSETIYLRLKENSIGNLYLRGDISVSSYGITYNMTNFTDVRYLIVPVMGAERFSTIIYMEPVKEGVLIYSMIGFYLPNFVADRVNITPSINRRITVFINWITDGLRQQATVSREQRAVSSEQ